MDNMMHQKERFVTIGKITVMLLVSIPYLSIGQIKIAGEQDGVFDSADYIVSKDLIVQEGKRLEFLPGSNLRFMPYTGLKVFGQLKLRDTKLVSSDTLDGSWNGIDVAPKGIIQFENVIISRSILGVGVADSSALKCFKKVTFSSNKSSLRIAEVPVFILEGKPFSMELSTTDDSKNEKINFTTDQSFSELNRPRSLKIATRWISSIAALSCAVLCAYYIEESVSYRKKYDSSENNADAQSFKTKSQKAKNISIATGIGTGVSCAVLILSFTIKAGSK